MHPFVVHHKKSQITWAYLAGFLDGDGWITSSKNKNCSTRYWVVGFTQKATRKYEMNLISEYLKSNGINCKIKNRFSKTPSSPKPVAMINIIIKEQESLKRLLSFLVPHILIKKNLALICLKYSTERIDKRGINDEILDVKPASKHWSEKELSKLKSLHSSGHGNRSIASKLGRSIESVAHKLYRMKLIRYKQISCAVRNAMHS